MTSPQPSRRLFWLLLLAGVVGITEAASHMVLAVSAGMLDEPIRRRSTILREQTERIRSILDTTRDRREELDPELGWRYRAGFGSETDNVTDQGLRGTRVYDTPPAAGVLRVAAFGDSFVYGNEVSDTSAWPAILESLENDLEILNYGVGGYGLDQSLLRFQREGMRLQPDLIMIGFAPVDLRRVVNVYRRFISSREWPFTKPRFRLREDGLLELVPNPLPRRDDYAELMENPRSVSRLGRMDQWYDAVVYEHSLYDVSAAYRLAHGVWRRLSKRLLASQRTVRRGVFNARSPEFSLQVAIFDAFIDAAGDSGVTAVVIMLPDRGSVQNLRQGLHAIYAPLVDSLASRGVSVWDAGEAFHDRAGTLDQLFMPGGHYSPAGNRVVAEWLLGHVTRLRPEIQESRNESAG